MTRINSQGAEHRLDLFTKEFVDPFSLCTRPFFTRNQMYIFFRKSRFYDFVKYPVLLCDKSCSGLVNFIK